MGLGAIRSVVSKRADSRIEGKLLVCGRKGLVRDGLVQLSVADLSERVGDMPRLVGNWNSRSRRGLVLHSLGTRLARSSPSSPMDNLLRLLWFGEWV
jgi:hypothetical protein